jgi:mono/diheme cytochrome c family protein
MRAVILGLMMLAGCVPAETAPKGQGIYESYCVSCHGTGGQGDGPVAPELPIAPVDLTMLQESNAGVFPTEEVMIQIYGYPGRFHQGLMPEFGPLLAGPMVDWAGPDGRVTQTPQALLDLVDYLRTLQQ